MNAANLLKLTIINHDDGNSVVAHFNPKEVQIDKSVPWSKQKNAKGDNPALEYTDSENRTMSLELLFDTYELKTSVYEAGVEALTAMTLVRKNAASEEQKRPPLVEVRWGAEANFPRFKGVIESLSVKYTMFLPDGTPVRATCSLKLKEAAAVRAKVRKQKSGGSPGASSSSPGASGGPAGNGNSGR